LYRKLKPQNVATRTFEVLIGWWPGPVGVAEEEKKSEKRKMGTAHAVENILEHVEAVFFVIIFADPKFIVRIV
jgi:hypothetical protein